MCRVKPDIHTYVGSVGVLMCVTLCVPGSVCVCMYMCEFEQVYMSVGAAHSFLHPSDPTRRKGCW